jgi:chromosome segregation ATPase
LRRKLVEAQEIAATASGNTEAVKRRYEARLRDASELAEKQIISLSKDLESAKRTIDLAEKAKEQAKADIKRAEDVFALKAKAYEEQIETVRKEVDAVNDEKVALLDKIDEAHAMHEELKKQRDAMEADLVETCSILEKVSEKASTSADEYKKAMAQVNAGTAALKETLEAEILLTMERVEEKELIIKEMETREAEREAQLELLKEKLSTNAAELKAYEIKLKDATAGERERLVVLQKENSRLEKRLTDTWAALQGAHAVAEQTKLAAKKAVGAANHAAAKAEKVALQAKQELQDIKITHSRDAENAARLQAQVHDLKGRDNAARTELERIKAEKDAEISRLKRNPAPSAPQRHRVSGALDDEMMRASDLLERLGRSRESSMRDETESQDRISNSDVASFRSFGYGGASALD